MKHTPIETRSATSIELRAEGDPPELEDLEEAIAAVNELRTGATAFETRINEQLAAVTARLDEREIRAQRPGNGGTTTDEVPLERRAFTGYLRRGREALQPDEARALIVGDDTAGGFLAPAEFVAEVIREIVQVSPIRQAARVGATSSGSVVLPKRTGRPTGYWVGETEDRTEAQATYGQAEIAVHEMAAYVDVSQRLLEDAAVNIEAEIAFDLAQEFGRLEGAALLKGDGIKKPEGIMTSADVSYTASGAASTLGSSPADTLIGHFYSLTAAYRARGVWMMNSTTLSAIRQLKDSSGRYLWQPSLAADQPETLLGRPVIEAPDMDDIGADAEPILFGDVMSAYRVYDRVQLAVMRDPFSVASKGLVRFHARRRLGGGTVLGEAVKKIKCAAA